MNILFDTVAKAISEVSALSAEEVYNKLEFSPNSELGDVAFPCFSLSAKLKKSPAVIAGELCGKLKEFKDKNPDKAIFEDVKVAGGYLNFFIDRPQILDFYSSNKENIISSIQEGNRGKKITIEHTSINPNASPHIGRARNAFIGDASVRLLRFLGFDVTVHYFVNDIGKQIALLVYCIKDKPDVSFDDLLALYVKANEQLKEDDTLNEKVFELLRNMENGDTAVLKEFARIVGICVRGQQNIFKELGIFYDRFDYESQYVQSGRTEEVLSALKNTGKLFEDESDRWVLNLEEFKLNTENPYLPLTRANKTSLYPLRDICYNIDKAKEGSFRNILILGEDQKLYGKQINAVLSLLEFKGVEIINYSFILLTDGKMSTRMGNVVLLEDLMRETVISAKNQLKEHIKDFSYTDEETEKLSKQIAYGAIKYSILKFGNEKNVTFDKESSLSFEGNTSVYIQYSHARIQSLLKDEKVPAKISSLSALKTDVEWEIVKKLLTFTEVLNTVSTEFNFSALCAYLFDLCKLFSRWYNECPIKTAEPALKKQRLFLASQIAETIKNGLHILGIEAPDRM